MGSLKPKARRVETFRIRMECWGTFLYIYAVLETVANLVQNVEARSLEGRQLEIVDDSAHKAHDH